MTIKKLDDVRYEVDVSASSGNSIKKSRLSLLRNTLTTTTTIKIG